MAKKYDLVIVGAGPGGAMAAKTAGETGLRTAVIERKTNPGEINRSCAMMFAIETDYYFAERMYYNDKAKKMVFPVNGFTVDYDGPVRNFYAWNFHAPDGRSRLSFGSYDENKKEGNDGRLSFVFDKGHLIDGLLKDAQKYDVDIFTGVNVTGIKKVNEKIIVTGNGEEYEGLFVIAADGINSRIADLMGFNKERTHFGTASKMSYDIKGLKLPETEAINILSCTMPDATFPIWISPCADGNTHMVEFKSKEHFDFLSRESLFAKWFQDIEILRTRSYVLGLWSPVNDPFKDNVLLVGDAAWFVEAEVTGSMMCGWKAANSIAVAIRDKKLNREGVKEYISWWKRSYPEFDDYREFFMIMLFMKSIFSDEELNYIYTRIDKPMRSTLNPFKVVGLIKDELKPLMPEIEKVKPAIVEKLNMLDINNFDKIAAIIKSKAG